MSFLRYIFTHGFSCLWGAKLRGSEMKGVRGELEMGLRDPGSDNPCSSYL